MSSQRVARLDVSKVTAAENLQVLGGEPAVLGDSGQHPRADFVVVMEGRRDRRSRVSR